MKRKFLFVAAVLLIATTAAWPQLRITSINSSGEITWTNRAWIAAYRVTWADSATGPWTAFDTFTNLNLILAETNIVSVQLPVSNAPAFYRVAWILPEPIGVWDYFGYDQQGTLVVTGQLNVASKTLPSGGAGFYQVQGTWNLQSTGQGNNSCLGNQMGAGGFLGTLSISVAELRLSWPTNCADCNLDLIGTLWPDSYIGTWYQYSCDGGHFTATRRR